VAERVEVVNGKVVFGLFEIAAAVFVMYLILARPSWFQRLIRKKNR
jgi:hypothetical protein